MTSHDSENILGADYARQWGISAAAVRNWVRRRKVEPIGGGPLGNVFRRDELDHARTTRRPYRSGIRNAE